MNILVLNGSPKGRHSITLQTVLFLEKKFSGHNFEVLHVGQSIKALERDFSKAREMLEKADMILFSYPVYTFIAPCQLHKFIELMKKSGVDFSGKFATQITTSKHFYDVTAHRYVQDNSQDMDMKYIRGLSADMDDLLTQKGQKEAETFFDYVLDCVENDIYEPVPVKLPEGRRIPVTMPKPESISRGGDVVIVTDCEEGNTQLENMIARFREKLPYNTRVVNLNDFQFKGGCLGCFNCATTGKCVYKDGFDDFLRNTIQCAQSIIYAFTIKDHSMGPLFKMYDDRQFCNGHRTVTMGMPVGYLVSGDYSREFNLQMVLEGRSQVGGNFLAGIATDETDPDRAIDNLAHSLDFALKTRHTQPSNFLGVGGMKIFRDLIFVMQGLMREDHKFYKAHGQYDFPQKQMGRLVFMYLVGSMMKSKKLQEKMGKINMNEGMLMPYQKAIGVEMELMSSIKAEAEKKKKNKK